MHWGRKGSVPHAEANRMSSRGILALHTSNFDLLSPSGQAIVTVMLGGTQYPLTPTMPGPLCVAIEPMTTLSSKCYYPTLQKRKLSPIADT